MEAADETHESGCAMKSDAIEWIQDADKAGSYPWVVIQADGTRGVYILVLGCPVSETPSHELCKEIEDGLLEMGRALIVPSGTA